MPARSLDSVQPASVTAAAICPWFCAAVGPDPGAGPEPELGVALRPGASSSCCHSVSGSAEPYPSLAMQADHAFAAFVRPGSAITSLLMSSFIVSIPASEVANWASLNVSRMFKHLPAAACASAGVLAVAPGEPAPCAGSETGASKPSCAASEVPM